MRENGDFVRACEIYWGEWVNYEECNLQDEKTPETILIEKDAIRSLPKECRILAEIIINLPEEMFLVNGRLNKTFFRKFVRARTGWTIRKVNKIQNKLEHHLIEAVSM
jgi:hypothetical protein